MVGTFGRRHPTRLTPDPGTPTTGGLGYVIRVRHTRGRPKSRVPVSGAVGAPGIMGR